MEFVISSINTKSYKTPYMSYAIQTIIFSSLKNCDFTDKPVLSFETIINTSIKNLVPDTTKTYSLDEVFEFIKSI